MSYVVKEIFYSLQGEGNYTGRPSVFCRFSGCNLWSGREQDREKSPCRFCDTDFVGGTRYNEDELIEAILSLWQGGGMPHVVFTGGEPALQLTSSLIDRLKKFHVTVAVETNGTHKLPEAGPYWITMSPKVLSRIEVTRGNEVKLLYPLDAVKPEDVEHLDFRYFYLQPIDDDNYEENLKAAIAYCLEHPKWRLSTQNHKKWGIR